MRVRKGKSRVRLPMDFGSFFGVMLIVNKHERHALMITHRVPERDWVGVPTQVSLDGRHMNIWPEPDRSYEIRLSYYPAIKEV